MIFPKFWQKFPKKLANLVEFMLEKHKFPNIYIFFYYYKGQKIVGGRGTLLLTFVKIFPETQ
jgi:hypothetical protein